MFFLHGSSGAGVKGLGASSGSSNTAWLQRTGALLGMIKIVYKGQSRTGGFLPNGSDTMKKLDIQSLSPLKMLDVSTTE